MFAEQIRKLPPLQVVDILFVAEDVGDDDVGETEARARPTGAVLRLGLLAQRCDGGIDGAYEVVFFELHTEFYVDVEDEGRFDDVPVVALADEGRTAVGWTFDGSVIG